MDLEAALSDADRGCDEAVAEAAAEEDPEEECDDTTEEDDEDLTRLAHDLEAMEVAPGWKEEEVVPIMDACSREVPKVQPVMDVCGAKAMQAEAGAANIQLWLQIDRCQMLSRRCRVPKSHRPAETCERCMV